MLVRPEQVELEPANGDGDGVVAGEIVSQTFLGAVTRLKVTAGEHDLTADVSASRAGACPVGMQVRRASRARPPGVLTLEESPAAAPDGH